MSENNWKIGLIGELDETKSKSQINQDIESVQKSLKKLELTAKLNPNQLKALESQLNNLKISLTNVNISPTALNGLIKQINSALNGIQISSSVIGNAKSSGNSAKQISTRASKIQLSLDDGTYDSKLAEITAKTQQWTDSNDKARISIGSLKKAYQELVNIKTPGDLVGAEKKWQEELKSTTNEIKKRNAEYAKTSQVNAFHNQVQEWSDKNTAAHRRFGDQLQEILSKTSQGAEVTKTELEQLKNEYYGIINSARQAGKLGLNFFDSIKEQAKKFTQWVSVASVVMSGIDEIRKMSRAVIEVDNAMVELKKVSDATNNEIKNYFDEAAESAKDLGSSISDVISATADFSRLGYSLSDSSQLAKVATLYKNVGDGIDISEASSSIVSTMKAFKISAEDSMDIIDKFNEVGNNFAISSGEIGEALKRSASSLAVAGNSISQSIGLITAGNTVVQDADKVGTALKTMSLRMTSTTAELEQLGEDTEFACETLSDYRDLVMGLTHNKVDIIGDNGEYKATYQSLKEISEVWYDMNSMEQSALMKALFGARQANIGASILENFDVAEAAMKTAEKAAGSALKEQQAHEEGIQFSLDRLSASYQELSNHVLNSKLIKGVVDFGNTTINIIDNVIEKLGTLKTIGLGTALFAGFKNVGRANYISRPSLNVPTMISVL